MRAGSRSHARPPCLGPAAGRRRTAPQPLHAQWLRGRNPSDRGKYLRLFLWFGFLWTFGFWGCKLHCGLYLLLCPCGWVAFSPWRDKAGCCVLFGASAKQDLVGGGTKQAFPQGIQERVGGKFWQNLPNFPLSAVSCPQRSADGAFSLPTMLGSAGCVFRLGKLKQGSRRQGQERPQTGPLGGRHDCQHGCAMADKQTFLNLIEFSLGLACLDAAKHLLQKQHISFFTKNSAERRR